MKTIFGILGIFIIITACDYKRTPDCKISFFSTDFLIQSLYIIIGLFLYSLQYDQK